MKELIEYRNRNCDRCELSQGCKTVCLFGTGNLKAEIVFVGEAPGESEDMLKEPFVGRAGELLNRYFEEFGIKRKEVYITNIVKCRPPENMTPKAHHVKACIPYLGAELDYIKPKLIVCLGAVASKAILNNPQFSISKNRGKILYSPHETIKHIPVLCTYHPAGILRNQAWAVPTLQDFEKIIKYMKDGIPQPTKAKYKYGVAKNANSIVVDIETTGLNMYNPSGNIICTGTSTSDFTGFVTKHTDKVRSILGDREITKVGHFFKFDMKWFMQKGFEINGQIRDTAVEAHLLNENEPSFGLKELAMVYTDMGDYADEIDRILKETKDITKVPEKKLMVYCAKDADATHRLHSQFMPKIVDQGLLPLYKSTMEGYKIIANAENAGVCIDEDRMNYLSTLYKKKIDKIYRKIYDISGSKEFNPDSSVQLGAFLTDKLNLPIYKTTKKGKISVDKFVLDKLQRIDKTGFVKLILQLRKLRLDYAKYLDPDKDIRSYDKRVHADFKIIGTLTGRYSCANPNLQQVTKDSPIKSMFISRFKDGKIVQFDIDQGELRILAQHSKDKNLIKIFRSGQDIHRATASQVFNISIDDVSTEQRFAAKTINFGIIYGMGAEKLAATIGTSLPKASQYIRDYKDRLPGVKKYIEEMEHDILVDGYVKSLFGRYRHIPIIDDEDNLAVRKAKRQAVNSPIQGGLHDLNIIFMRQLHQELLRGKCRSVIILVVHDSIIVDCPDVEVDYVVDAAREVVQQLDTKPFGFELVIPITISVGIGNNWKEASESD